MRRLMRALVFILVVVAIAWLAGWHDTFHVVIGVITIALIWIVALVWKRSRQGENGDESTDGPTESRSRAAVAGLIGAIVISFLLWVVFACASRLEFITSLFYDSDRSKFEEEIAYVVKAGNHEMPITRIQERLAKNLSREWRESLQACLYKYLVEDARAVTNLERRRELLTRAVAVAKTYKLDGDLAAALLQQSEVFEQLRAERRWDSLAAALESSMGGEDLSDRKAPYAQWLYQAYISSADDCKDAKTRRDKLDHAYEVASKFSLDTTIVRDRLNDLNKAEAEYAVLIRDGDNIQDSDPQRALEHRRDFYQHALNIAKANNLDLQPDATSRLNEVEKQLAALSQPSDLPPGTRANLVQISLDQFPQSVAIELTVEQGSGEPLRGLVAKDFVITCFGRQPSSVALAAVVEKELPPLYLIVALDCSGSMDGLPFRAAIQGGQDLLLSLVSDPSVVWVKVLSFSNSVRTVCDWTQDKGSASRAIAGLSAGGNTAMFAAVRQALEELRVRSGQKRLILFTDGRNTVPKPGDNLASLTAALQQADVEVFTIGLRAADLDVGTLSELATNTGGRFFDAARPEELRSAFSTARQQLRRAIYRLVVTPNVPTDVAQLPVEVKIGCANAVVLRKTMPLSKVNRSATYDSTAPGRPPRHTNISHDTDN